MRPENGRRPRDPRSTSARARAGPAARPLQARPLQRHHRRRGRARRPQHHHRGRRQAEGRRGPGAHRRHRDPAQRGNIFMDRLAGGAFVLNGAGEVIGPHPGRRVGPHRDADSAHQHDVGRRGVRRASPATWSRSTPASATSTTSSSPSSASATTAGSTTSPATTSRGARARGDRRGARRPGAPRAAVGGGTGHDHLRLQGRHRHELAQAARGRSAATRSACS